MGAKDVEKLMSQSRAPPPGTAPIVRLRLCRSISEAIQEGKGSDSRDKIRSRPCSGERKGIRSAGTAEGHVPNAETAKVLREAREGKNLLHYECLEEMFKDLGI